MFHLRINEMALLLIFNYKFHHISFSNNLIHIMFFIVIVTIIIVIKAIITAILIIIIRVIMLINLIMDLIINVIQVQLFKIIDYNYRLVIIIKVEIDFIEVIK